MVAEGNPSRSQERTERRGLLVCREEVGERLRVEQFSELYAVGCVMENPPLKLSVKSTLLTNALGGWAGGVVEGASWERAKVLSPAYTRCGRAGTVGVCITASGT